MKRGAFILRRLEKGETIGSRDDKQSCFQECVQRRNRNIHTRKIETTANEEASTFRGTVCASHNRKRFLQRAIPIFIRAPFGSGSSVRTTYLNYIHPAGDSTEDGVLIVQPRSRHRCDEELRPVRPRPCFFVSRRRRGSSLPMHHNTLVACRSKGKSFSTPFHEGSRTKIHSLFFRSNPGCTKRFNKYSSACRPAKA